MADFSQQFSPEIPPRTASPVSNSFDFAPSDAMPNPGPVAVWGKLYGIGAGPGDPELITVKGLRILQRSPLVAFPAGRNGQPGIAQQIITPWLRPAQQLLPLDFPYIQDDAALQRAWDQAAAEVLPHLAQGQDIAFVSEGDVSFYSTFSYLAHSVRKLALAATQAYRDNAVPGVTSGVTSATAGPEIFTIPGICSPLAAAAAVGSPLTLRQQKLIVLPALYDRVGERVGDQTGPGQSGQLESQAAGSSAIAPSPLDQALDLADVVVLMKIGAEYATIWSLLKARNLLERSYIVERATWPEQQIHRGLGDRPSSPSPTSPSGSFL